MSILFVLCSAVQQPKTKSVAAVKKYLLEPSGLRQILKTCVFLFIPIYFKLCILNITVIHFHNVLLALQLWLWMEMSVGLLVIKFSTSSHGPQRMYPNDFGGPLTF